MAVLTFTVPGIPLSILTRSWINKRLEFKRLRLIGEFRDAEFYRKLIDLKGKPALWNGNAGGEIQILESQDNSVLLLQGKKARVGCVIMNSASAITSSIEFGDVAGL